MSVVVVVREVKRNAVGCGTPEQVRRWELWLRRHTATARVRELPGTSTFIGNDWQVDCDDLDHAEWLRDWLITDCGFTASMLSIRRLAR